MSLNIDQLRTFCDLYVSRSFTQTARNLNIRESTVSYRIREMEEFFEKKLFHRRGDKTVDCTEFGELFYPQAKQILSMIDSHLENKEGVPSSGVIRVVAGEIGGVHLLPQFIKAFEHKFDGLKVQVDIKNSYEAIKQLAESECDVGLTASIDFPGAYNRTVGDITELIKIEYGVVVPPGHYLLDHEKVRPRELLGIPYVSRGHSSGSHRNVLKILQESGIKEEDLNVVWKFENSSSVIHAVSEGLGVSIVSKVQASKYVQAGLIGYRPLETKVLSYIYLIDHWKGRNTMVNTFKDYLKYFVETSGISL